jgi:predicted RNA-binding protein YlqC (UPF0109 family)
MKELIEYIARSIVDQPDEVTVTEVPAEDGIILRLQVAPDDTGKVIGKEGRIAKAMRTLLRVAAIRKGTRATLEIISDAEPPRRSPEPRSFDSGSSYEPDSGPDSGSSYESDSGYEPDNIPESDSGPESASSYESDSDSESEDVPESDSGSESGTRW